MGRFRAVCAILLVTAFVAVPYKAAEGEEETAANAQARAVAKAEEQIAGIIKTAEQLDGISDTEEILEKTLETIDAAGDALSGSFPLNAGAQVLTGIEGAVSRLARKSMRAIGKYEYPAIIKNGALRATVARRNTLHLDDKIFLVKRAKIKINEALRRNKLNVSVTSALTVAVKPEDTAGPVTKADISAQSFIFDGMKKKGVDVFVLELPLCSMTFPCDILPVDESAAVSFLFEKPEAGSLDAETKALAADGTVIDIGFQIGGQDIRNAQKTVCISLPLKYEGGAPEKLVAFQLKGKRASNIPGCVYDRQESALEFGITAFGRYMVKYSDISYTDMEDAKWAQLYAEAMTAQSVAKGTGKGLFNPGGTVSKAEFVRMLSEALDLPAASKIYSFNDVKSYEWFYKYIASAAAAGLIEDTPGTAFSPNARITREDMGMLMGKALEKFRDKKRPTDTSKYLDCFRDRKSISGRGEVYIALALKYGLIPGTEDAVFSPRSYCTRAEAAAAVYRLYYLP